MTGARAHHFWARAMGHEILYFDSQQASGQVITQARFYQEVQGYNASLFQVTVHINHEPIFHSVFVEFDTFLEAPAFEWSRQVQFYANYRETNRISVSK